MNDNYDTTKITIGMIRSLATVSIFNAIAEKHEKELAEIIENLESVDDEAFLQVISSLGYSDDVEQLAGKIIKTIAQQLRETSSKATGNTATGHK